MAVSDGMGGALAGEVASTMAVETVSEKLLDEDVDETLTQPTARSSPHQPPSRRDRFRKLSDPSTGPYRPAISGNGRDIYRDRRDAARLPTSSRSATAVRILSETERSIRSQRTSRSSSSSSTPSRSLPRRPRRTRLKNVILQALGAQNEIYPVSARDRAACKDDVFLLCSDGLSNKVGAADMQRIVVENFDKLENACAELIKRSQRERRRGQHHGHCR